MASDKEMKQVIDLINKNSTGNDSWARLEDEDNNSTTGFHGSAYRNKTSGEIIVVFEGSNDLSIGLRGSAKDWISNDGSIVAGAELPQAREALRFFNKIINKYGDDGISVTGHSLGGALASVVAYDTGCRGTVFDSPGMGGRGYSKDIVDSQTGEIVGLQHHIIPNEKGIVKNLTDAFFHGDIVGESGGEHIGIQHVFSNADSESKLTEKDGAYSLGLLIGVETKRLISCHDMVWWDDSNLYDEQGNIKESSIVSGHNGAGICRLKDTFMMLNNFFDWWDKIAQKLFKEGDFLNKDNPYNPFGEATTVPSYRDPLVLDLNGDGITMGSALDSYAQFDLDAGGFKERVGWINAKDGFLARDLNGNSKIDSGRELFGEHTLLKNGKLATNGFAALSDLDSNGDGIVDAKDTEFTSLKVWRDVDGDGATDDGELLGLDRLGITGINIWHEVTDKLDKNYNTETGLGSFNKKDGSKGLLKQYLLSRDTINSIPTEEDEEDYGDKINAAPNLRGMGNVYSLHRAMASDKSGELYDLVMAFGAEKDIQNRYKLLDKILAKWTGCDKVPTGSRDVFINAVYLGVLEKLFGTNFVGTAGLNPGYDAGILLSKQYEEIRRHCYEILAMQTFAADIVSSISCTYDVDKKSFSLDLSKVQELIGNLADKDLHQAGIKLADALLVADALGVQALKIGEFNAPFKNYNGLVGYYANAYGKMELTATEEILSVRYSQNATALFGRQVKDLIDGGRGNDVLYGRAGDDSLYGGWGDDVLIGGEGNDYLDGGWGDDTYIWGKGDGNDEIHNDTYYDCNCFNNPGNDTLLFQQIAQAEVEFSYNGDDLLCTFTPTNECIKIRDWQSGSFYQVNNFAFSDGVVKKENLKIE